jgi:hypothetical protein
MVSTENGWLVGDAVPEPAEGLYWHPSPGGRVLMPAWQIASAVFAGRQLDAPQRCKLCRSAAISLARSRWGPGATGEPWAPTAAAFNPVRSHVEALVGHAFWERVEVIGALVHLALPKRDAATTIDLAVRFADGELGLLAIWGGVAPLMRPELAWAELGAAVAAMADSGIPVAKAVVAWVEGPGDAPKVRLEARPGDQALGLWVDALDLERSQRRYLPGVNHGPA